MPALEVEKGKVICQSMAIARYLAKKYGLAGSGELEQAQVDMVAECIADTMNSEWAPCFFFHDNQGCFIAKGWPGRL